MRSFKNILVVIEPKQLRQVALERALVLNSIAHKGSVNIFAVMPVFDFSWDITSILSIEQENDMTKQVVKKYEKWLKAYLSIHAMGIDIKTKVIWSKTLGKSLTAYAKEIQADVIIKAADSHGVLDSVLFTPLDWQLLRHSPVPVIIAKDHIWQPSGVIAVALDVSDKNDVQSMQINNRLIREAQELAFITKCKIHLLNAYTPFIPLAAADSILGYSQSVVDENDLKLRCKNLFDFAKDHKICADNCHIREGVVDEVIPAICNELKPTALFIGTSARKGLSVALIGNICERVIDDLDCDVVVITPKSVLNKIPYASDEQFKN